MTSAIIIFWQKALRRCLNINVKCLDVQPPPVTEKPFVLSWIVFLFSNCELVSLSIVSYRTVLWMNLILKRAASLSALIQTTRFQQRPNLLFVWHSCSESETCLVADSKNVCLTDKVRPRPTDTTPQKRVQTQSCLIPVFFHLADFSCQFVYKYHVLLWILASNHQYFFGIFSVLLSLGNWESSDKMEMLFNSQDIFSNLLSPALQSQQVNRKLLKIFPLSLAAQSHTSTK